MKIFLALTLLLLALILGGFVAQKRPRQTIDERFLFFPSKHPEGTWESEDLIYKDVWFTSSDGTRLHAWYCPADNPRAVLLYLHGNAGHLADRTRLLRQLQDQVRVTTLIVDYRGYGRSEGVPTVKGVIADARAARAALAAEAEVPESEIVVMGRSLGGAVAIELAAEAPPRGLVIESTFSSLRNAASHHFSALAVLVPKSKLNAAAKIRMYEGPLLQSHGRGDETIPYEMGRQLFEAANQPKRFVDIPDGMHNDPQTAEYYEALAAFLDGLGE